MRAPEVKAFVDALAVRVDNIDRTLAQLVAEHKATAQLLNDHRRELEREVALLKRDVEELKKGRDVWGGRIFTLVLALLTGLIGALLGPYFKKP